jgi:phage-related protein (TIGR01555 family)
MEKDRMVAFDGWQNLFDGRGVLGKDKRLSTTFSARNLLTEGELSEMYTTDGLARKIVDKPVEEMMKRGFKVEGDVDSLIQATFDELDAWTSLNELLTWARLFGGAVMVMGLDDGQLMDMPVNERGLRRVDFLRVYDRHQVTVNYPTDLYNDPIDRRYGQIQFYNVQPLDGSMPFRVHESRVVVCNGENVPQRVRILNQGWGLPVLQTCFDQLRQVGMAYDDVETILDSFVTTTVTINNLMELIAGGQESAIKRRLELMDLSRSMLNTILLDKEETFEKKASTVTGLPEVMDRYLQALSAVSNIPLRVLMGQQVGGMNNKGEGETGDWYDLIASKQVREYKPILETLVRYCMLAREGYFKGRELKDWFIVFNPLTQPTQKEIAETRKINAEADCAYVNVGVLDATEVAISRFGGAKYGDDIKLNEVEDRNLEKPESKKKEDGDEV